MYGRGAIIRTTCKEHIHVAKHNIKSLVENNRIHWKGYREIDSLGSFWVIYKLSIQEIYVGGYRWALGKNDVEKLLVQDRKVVRVCVDDKEVTNPAYWNHGKEVFVFARFASLWRQETILHSQPMRQIQFQRPIRWNRLKIIIFYKSLIQNSQHLRRKLYSLRKLVFRTDKWIRHMLLCIDTETDNNDDTVIEQ